MPDAPPLAQQIAADPFRELAPGASQRLKLSCRADRGGTVRNAPLLAHEITAEPALADTNRCIRVTKCTCHADRDGTVLDAPPLAQEIAAEPALADARLVAAPADATLLPRGGARGFPHWAAWSERNAGFAVDVVRFMAEGAPTVPCSWHCVAVASFEGRSGQRGTPLHRCT